jgi:uncharacterized membrane protein
MSKKRLHLGKAISLAFGFVVKFPKFVLLPVLAMLIVTFGHMYLTQTVEILKSIPRAEMIAKGIHYTLSELAMKNLFNYFYLFVLWLLGFMILSGYIRMIKQWIQQKIEPTWNDFFAWKWQLFGKFLVLSLFMVAYLLIGTLLLIVPGFIVLITYIFAQFVLIDTNCEIGKAMEQSAKLSKGIKGPIFGMILLYILYLAPGFYISSQSFYHPSLFLPYLILWTFIGTCFGQII